MPCIRCETPSDGRGLWALVDCNNFYASCEQLFRPDLAERVLAWTGLPVSVGAAATKTLAKLANHAAKRGDGIYCLPPGPNPRADELLAAVPASGVWGVGRRLEPKLAARGIRSALDLKNADDAWIRRHFSVTLWRTVLELRGLPCVDENGAPAPRRTVMYSRSFGNRVRGEAPLAEAVAFFTARAAEKLRRSGLLASSLAVHIRTARHGQGLWRDVTRDVSLPAPCADSAVLIKHALTCLRALYAPGYAYAKAGVMLGELARRGALQGDLLQLERLEDEQARGRLMEAMDLLNRRYGRNAVHYAAEGPAEAAWHMRRKRCSPAFTTRWNELPVAHCR